MTFMCAIDMGDQKFWLVRMYYVTQRCQFLIQIFSYSVVLRHVPWGTGTFYWVPVLCSKLALYGLLWNREFSKLSVHGWDESRSSYCPVFSNPFCLTADTTVGKYLVCFCDEECELNCYAALESCFLPFMSVFLFFILWPNADDDRPIVDTTDMVSLDQSWTDRGNQTSNHERM